MKYPSIFLHRYVCTLQLTSSLKAKYYFLSILQLKVSLPRHSFSWLFYASPFFNTLLKWGHQKTISFQTPTIHVCGSLVGQYCPIHKANFYRVFLYCSITWSLYYVISRFAYYDFHIHCHCMPKHCNITLYFIPKMHYTKVSVVVNPSQQLQKFANSQRSCY